jgi:hypothetical protein
LRLSAALPAATPLRGGPHPERHIIFDAGSGLRELGLALMKGEYGRDRGEAHLFMSQPIGTIFRAFPFSCHAVRAGNRIFIYSPKKDIQGKIHRQQTDQDMFPVRLGDMAATMEFVTMEGMRGCSWTASRSACLPFAPPGGS